MKSGNYAYIGRKQRKRNFRSLWITRISAACRANGVNYSTFMNGVSKAGITLNRKMLSEIAIGDPAAFSAIVEQAKAALYAKKNVRFLKQTGRLRLDGRVDML